MSDIDDLVELLKSGQTDGYSKVLVEGKLREKAEKILRALNFEEQMEGILERYKDSNLASKGARSQIINEFFNALSEGGK